MHARKYLPAILFMLLLQPAFSGCALFLLGAGAAGGYSISKDEVEGHTDLSFAKTLDAARDVLAENGVITQDLNNGMLEAKVLESEVKVSVEQITEETVRLRVKARKVKGLFPDIKLAQNLHGKILKKMEAKAKRWWF